MSRMPDRNFWADESGDERIALPQFRLPATCVQFIIREIPADWPTLNIVCGECRPELSLARIDTIHFAQTIQAVTLQRAMFMQGSRYKKSDGTEVVQSRDIETYMGQCDRCGTVWIVLPT